MTSKGTFTLPARIRKDLGLTKAGDKLLVTYHPQSHRVVIEKPADMREIQAKNAAIVKAKGIKPLTPGDLRALREEMHTERYERYLKNNDKNDDAVS